LQDCLGFEYRHVKFAGHEAGVRLRAQNCSRLPST
jgi:hypothetical protein